MGGFKGLDRVFVVIDPFPGFQFPQFERVAQPPDQRPQHREELFQPRRPEDPQRRLPVGQVIRFQQPRAAPACDRRGSGSGRSRRPAVSPIDFCICRCVPSPQSKSNRSPPRAISTAAVERRAEGADAPVPRNVTSRSMTGEPTRPDRAQALRRHPTVDLELRRQPDSLALVVPRRLEAQAAHGGGTSVDRHEENRSRGREVDAEDVARPSVGLTPAPVVGRAV